MKRNHRTRLPTRVVDCQHPTAPRLVISADLEDDTVPYVALSYVWGQNTSHCTYLANYEAYLRMIDHAVIPQTIRDAILVAHDYGVRYIWIDAFCIIQNSDEYKTRELVKMGSIYQEAYFTIIASSAASGDDGFLQDRTLPPHFRVPCYGRPDRPGSVYIGRRSDTVCPVAPVGEPVDRRAWCFQEWLLSPRKLIYATDTLRYHCQTSARPVEDSLRAIRTVHSATLDHTFLPLRQAMLANPDLAELSSEEHFARQCALWGLVVTNYTQRLLTQKTDKLLAFAAVAEQFDRTWQPDWHPGRYVAGLWERFLPRDLLWYRELASQQGVGDCLRPRPVEYLAPSWAWPSVDGRVITRSGSEAERVSGGDVVDVCEVLECNVALMDKRLPFGRIANGHLKLRAIVAPACIILDLPHQEHGREYGEDFYYKLFAPTAELKALAQARVTSLGLHSGLDTGIQIGTMILQDSYADVVVPVITHEYHALQEGRLAAVGWGTFKGDQSLLKRVGEANIHFDVWSSSRSGHRGGPPRNPHD
ncbi:HET-domain-containing protein [Cubamyces sp. BRFM 1775]|nr:HET-domain-containing protein [Cubamyces sp. BRFM 1775]